MERIYSLVVDALAEIISDSCVQAETRVGAADTLLLLLRSSFLARRCTDALGRSSRPGQ